jgi:magnesium transporter
MIVDNAIYVDGRRTPTCALEDTYETCRERRGIAWIALYEPSEEEFRSVTGEFELHELAVEDAIQAHQRPKIERYGNSIFVVLRSARYVEKKDIVEFGEIHAFVGEDFVVTVRHGDASRLGNVRQDMESRPDLLSRGPMAILWAILDKVVDDYSPVVDGVENDIDEIETEVFGGNAKVSRRIYEVAREVIEFQRATKPLVGVLSRLIEDESDVESELRRYLRDVQDHALQVVERIESFRELLSNILGVNLAVVGLAQNEEVEKLTRASIEQNDQVKKISSWAAILAVPTIITGVYGMNFDHIPELDWLYGYPFALALVATVSGSLYLIFKRRGWL